MKILPRLARYTAGGVGTPKAPRTWLSPGPALVPSGHCLRPSPAPHATRAGGGEGDTAHAALRPITHLRQPRWAPGPEPGTPRLPHAEPPPRHQQHNQRHHAEETRSTRSRRIVSLRGRSTRRFPASRPAPESLLAPGLSSSSGGSAGAEAQAWRRGARGAGARDTTGGQRRGCSRASRGWPLGASFALTPSHPQSPPLSPKRTRSGEVAAGQPARSSPALRLLRATLRADETRRSPTGSL